MTTLIYPEIKDIPLIFVVAQEQRYNKVCLGGRLGKEEARVNRLTPQLRSNNSSRSTSSSSSGRGRGGSGSRRSFLVATSLISAAQLAAQDQERGRGRGWFSSAVAIRRSFVLTRREVGVKGHRGNFLLSLKEQRMHLESLRHGVVVKRRPDLVFKWKLQTEG